jgi:ribosome-associated translation inhibitor RaiA
MEVSWRGPDGMAIKEHAVAKQVNGQGGMLEMANYPEIGSRVSLTNFLSAETAEARVLATPSSREGVSHGIIVELIVPNESFWGVNLQVKKASVELLKLEKSLQSEGIDFRLLNEFRDAVDYVRTTAIAVQRLRESQLRGQPGEDVTSSLIAERVRRATNLCLEVITDVDAGNLKAETKGAEELYHSLEQACDRLRRLLKRREPDRSLVTRT